MIAALLAALLPAPAPDAWQVLLAQDGVEYAFAGERPAPDGRIAVTLRAKVPPERNGFSLMQMDLLLDCATQTQTIMAARAYDDAGAIVRSRDTAPGEERPQPILRGDAAYEQLYDRLCPAGAPLKTRAPAPPPVPVQRP